MQIIDKSVYTFSKDNLPFCTARPGETLLFRSMDCFSGLITSEDQQIKGLSLSQVNPAAGPVFVEGAEPGDVLVVDVLDITVADSGVCRTAGKSTCSSATPAVPYRRSFQGKRLPNTDILGCSGLHRNIRLSENFRGAFCAY